ncbi:MAG: ArnT family glycosyltransferase [Phycisphaerales bacterium JB037]
MATWWLLLTPVLCLLAATLPHLDQGGYRKDTGRYAAVGLQAWRDGHAWTLYLHPEEPPYFAKPPLAFWIHGLSMHALGVQVWAARLPSILAAAGCVLLTVLIARAFFRRPSALAAGVTLAFTYEFFRRAREISLDLWQLLFLLGALWLVSVAITRNRRALWLLAGIPIGLALMTKPLAALTAYPLLIVWLLWIGRARLIPWCLGGMGVALAVALPWHGSMYAIHGSAFTDAYFGSEVVARAQGEIQTRSPLYFVSIISRTYWPWLIPATLGVVEFVRRRRELTPGSPAGMGLRLAIVWALGWLVLLSAFPDKHPRYALPIYPALALLAGWWTASCAPAALRGALHRARPFVAPGAVAVLVLVSLLPIRFQRPRHADWRELSEFLADKSPDLVWSRFMGSNDRGEFYLDQGYWPRSADGPDGAISPDLPEGALIVTKHTGELMPHAPGRVVFESSDGVFMVRRNGRVRSAGGP